MASFEWPPQSGGGGGGGVTSVNTLTGAITLAAGSGISITPSGNTLTIATTSGVTFPLLAPDGTVSAPSYSWAAETTTGLFRPSGSTMGVTVAGGQVFQFNAGSNDSGVPFRVNNGSAALPSLTLINSSTTGLYRFAANSLGFTTNAVTAGHIDATQNWFFPAQIFAGPAAPGSAANPTYTFAFDPLTGVYLASGSALGISVNATQVMQMNQTSIEALTKILSATGTSGAPEYSFLNDATSGMYLNGVGNLGFSGNILTNGSFQIRTVSVSANYSIL